MTLRCRLQFHKWGERQWARHGSTSGRSWFRDCVLCGERQHGFRHHGAGTPDDRRFGL